MREGTARSSQKPGDRLLEGKRMLIYDVGMHNGDDTAYYLAKGARVIAIEANPQMCEAAEQRFAAEIATGRLTILNVAVGDRDGEAEFFIDDTNSVLSSLVRRGTMRSLTTRMRRLSDVFDEHGLPDFAKIDVEHVDHVVIEDLRAADRLPQHISVEAHRQDVVEALLAAGYRAFRLVNCAEIHHRFGRLPIRTVQGTLQEHVFAHHSSGPFGDDLPEPWVSGEAARQAWIDRRAKLGKGWFDIHARMTDITEADVSTPTRHWRQRLVERLYPDDPYASLNGPARPLAALPEAGEPLAVAMAVLRPRTVAVFGSFLSALPLEIAAAAERLGLVTQVLVIDTWLGDHDRFFEHRRAKYGLLLDREHGYPSAYQRFLSDVVRSGLAHRVIPVAATMQDGTRILGTAGIACDLIVPPGLAPPGEAIQHLHLVLAQLSRGGAILRRAYVGKHWSSLPEQVMRRVVGAERMHLLSAPGWHMLGRDTATASHLSVTRPWRSLRADLSKRTLRKPWRPAPAAEAIDLRNARVLPAPHWLVVASGEPVCANPTWAHRHAHAGISGATMSFEYRRPVQHVCADTPVVVVGGSPNYYHHLVDYMLRLFSVERGWGEAAVFLTSADTARFQPEMRDFFDLPAHRTLFSAGPTGVLHCSRVLLPGMPVQNEGEVVNPGAIDRLRAFVRSKILAPRHPARLYVSRAKAARRRLREEDALWAQLEAEGFCRLFLEEMPFGDQVAAFSGADVVVGVHGAGLANIVFAPPGARIVEIMPATGKPGAFFRNLAPGCGHQITSLPAAGQVADTEISANPTRVLEALRGFG